MSRILILYIIFTHKKLYNIRNLCTQNNTMISNFIWLLVYIYLFILYMFNNYNLLLSISVVIIYRKQMLINILELLLNPVPKLACA